MSALARGSLQMRIGACLIVHRGESSVMRGGYSVKGTFFVCAFVELIYVPRECSGKIPVKAVAALCPYFPQVEC